MNQKELWDKIAPEWDEYKKIASKLSIDFLEKQRGNIIDLGSGSGRHLINIRDGKLFLVDFSKEMIELARKKAKKSKINSEFVVANMNKLPFENNFFDSGISISSIHCVPKKDHKKIVKEIYRVLKPKAKFLVCVWNKESKRFKKYKEKEKYIGWSDKGKRYYYLFTKNEIQDLFKKNGFDIIKEQNSELMIRFIAVKKNKI